MQCDWPALLKLSDEAVFSWVVRLDDLKVFLPTLRAQGKTPQVFVDFLPFREELHGKLTYLDELAICGGFLSGQLTAATTRQSKHVAVHPDWADVFDAQYRKGLGFENEKPLAEKQSGWYLFVWRAPRWATGLPPVARAGQHSARLAPSAAPAQEKGSEEYGATQVIESGSGGGRSLASSSRALAGLREKFTAKR